LKRITTGAYMASAAEKAPKRNGPAAPNRPRASAHSFSMRSMFACTSGFMPLPGCEERMFMGMFERRSRKPECISAAAQRAKARETGSFGHTPLSGNHSCTASAMASESHTVCLSRHSTGHEAGWRPALDLGVPLVAVEAQLLLLEGDAELLQEHPRPHGPRRVVLVADHERQRGHAHLPALWRYWS
jgi:hypothetical protein